MAIRNRLNQAVSSLRRQLHPPELGPGSVLVTDHHSIAINTQTVISDVEEFEKEIRQADKAETEEERLKLLAKAVDRYRGELLESYYEEWVFSRRMHLADLYDKALQHLIRSHVANNSLDLAIDYARRRLQIDPYDEGPHVILMRLYLRASRPKSAIKQFEDLQRMLVSFADEPSSKAVMYKDQAEAMANDQLVELAPDDDFAEVAPRKAETVSAAIVRPTIQSTLPRIVSSFVGREAELASIENYVRERSTPLISILGLGGFGKTRLAIETGWRLLEKQQLAVFFVPLANLESHNDLAPAIARNLYPNQNNPPEIQDPFEMVVDRLNSIPSCLLILDNFEQLVDTGAKVISNLLQRVPKLKIIVTTRIPLNVEGEVLISLSPLPVPDENNRDLKELAANPSVALFVDRAQAVKTDFQLTERTSQALVALSRKLEGLPLGIELAAGWARVLTPSQMVEQVSSNVNKLASRRKDIAPRHRSLRAAFDGSYELLSESLQNVFLRLTFLVGGWELESAQHLCPGENIDEAIQALEERSLIFSEPTDRAIRFSMLETVRSFGQSLASADLRSECGWLHAEFFLNLIERDDTPVQRYWKVGADYANFIVALNWLKDNERVEEFARMVIALSRYWEARGLLADGRYWQTTALQMGTLIDPLLLARIKAGLANLDWLVGNFDDAVDRMTEALELFKTYEAKSDQLDAQFLLLMEAHRRGDYETAKRLLRANLEIAQSIDDSVSEAKCWLALGNVAVEEGDFEDAQRCYERSLEIGRQTEDNDRIGSALTNLGNLAIYRNQTEAARKWVSEACSFLDTGVYRWRAAMGLIVLARLENEEGDHVSAIQTLIRALNTAPNEKLVVWRFLLQFGYALAGMGQTQQAIRTFGFFERFRERIGESHQGIEMRLYEDRLKKLRQEVSGETFEEQFEIGRTMSFEEIETMLARTQRSF